MGKRFRQRMSGLIIFLMVLSLFPNTVMAATQEPAVNLEQAIQTVKQHFTVPEDYTDFSSTYRSSDDKQVWALNWNTQEERTGRFNAEVDAKTGIIISMNIWKEGQHRTEIPVLSIEEATSIGSKLLGELIPDYLSRLKPVAGNKLIPLTSWDGGQYILEWQRMEGNIPVDSEGVRLHIDYTNGQIKEYNLSWSDNKLPSPTGIISGDKAQEVFAKNQMLELQYLLPDDQMEVEAANDRQAKLVYRIHHPSQGTIDALTGQPVEYQDMRMMNDKMIPGGMGSRESAAEQSVLSPEEQKEVEQNLSLISQDKATSIVEKWVPFPNGLELKGVNLARDWGNKERRIWNLNWQSEATNSDANVYLNARVDATTGELLSFNKYGGKKIEGKTQITQEAAQKIASKFVEKISPERVKQLRLEPNDDYGPDPLEKGVSIPEWRFDFDRTVDEIPYPAEGIGITVNSTTKEICSYYLNWTETVFPSSNNVMTTEKAYDRFLADQPLTLHYMRTYSEVQNYRDDSWNYKLVYTPMPVPPMEQSELIDAVSGEKLGWEGQELSQNRKAKEFTDIEGHFAEQEIALLGQAGIMCEYETAFHPTEEITLVTFLRAMLMARNNYSDANAMSDEKVIKVAVRNKWLTQQMDPNTIVSRELLATLMVRLLDVEFIAKMPAAALQAPYQDYASLSAESKGYAALTWGLGIIQGEGKNFNAAHKITRGEAAAALIRSLKVAGQRNNY